jgi:putative colanic acid biosynthesis acetyltransferase WcaF
MPRKAKPKSNPPREGGANFSRTHICLRFMWNICWLLLASWTPPPFYPWRRALLRLFGAQMAPRSDVRGSARVWYPPNLIMESRTVLAGRVTCYNMARITVRSGAVVSQGAHLCAGTHDVDDEDFRLITRPIEIGAESWIAAEAFVGPGVRVGTGAVLGARAVTFRDLAPWTIYVGNPAMPRRERKRFKLL